MHASTVSEGASVSSGILCFPDLTLKPRRTSAAPIRWWCSGERCFSSPPQWHPAELNVSSKHVPNMQTCSCFSLIVVSLHSVLCNPCTCLEVSPMDVLIPSVARRWGFDHFHLLTSKGGASLNTVRSPGAAAGLTAGHTGKYIFTFKKERENI